MATSFPEVRRTSRPFRVARSRTVANGACSALDRVHAIRDDSSDSLRFGCSDNTSPTIQALACRIADRIKAMAVQGELGAPAVPPARQYAAPQMNPVA